MKRAWVTAALILAACGQSQNTASKSGESLTLYDVAPPAEQPGPPAAGPQIAYTYTLSYALDDAAITGAQAQAVAACRKLGPTRCLVVKSDLNRGPDSGDGASLNLLIDARLAATFNQRLDGIAASAGGEATGRNVSAEDVTKQVVDTAARVRAKQALADRLLGIIRTANGKVGELIEAEKAYAEVQEELDAARSLAAELRRRVAMSAVQITYASTRATVTWAPVTDAGDGLAGSFASSIAAAITFVAVAIPWALLLAGLLWLIRRIGWRPRWPWRRGTGSLPPTA